MATSAQILPSVASAHERHGGSLITAGSLIGPATMLTVLGLILPLMLLLRYSLNLYDPIQFMIETVSLDNYIKFFTDTYYTHVFWTDDLGRGDLHPVLPGDGLSAGLCAGAHPEPLQAHHDHAGGAAAVRGQRRARRRLDGRCSAAAAS